MEVKEDLKDDVIEVINLRGRMMSWWKYSHPALIKAATFYCDFYFAFEHATFGRMQDCDRRPAIVKCMLGNVYQCKLCWTPFSQRLTRDHHQTQCAKIARHRKEIPMLMHRAEIRNKRFFCVLCMGKLRSGETWSENKQDVIDHYATHDDLHL